MNLTRKRNSLVLGLCVVFSMGVLMGGCKKPPKIKKKAPIPVEVSRVKRQNIQETLFFTGDLKGEAEVQVFATVPDRIKQMKVDIGDIVKKGQTIAVIEHTRLRHAVAQAQAQLAAVRSQLAGAQIGLAGAVVGRSSAKREFLRLRRLLRGGAVGQQQVDMAKTQYDGTITKVRAAKAQMRALKAQIRALRAGVAQASTMRRNAIIRAPISGIVARRYRQVGDMATPQLPLVTLVRMDKVKVNINLSEEELGKVRVGKKASIRVTSYRHRIFTGRIVKVAPTLDIETRTAPVEVEIPNLYAGPTPQRCRRHSDCGDSTYSYCHKKSRRLSLCVERHPLKPGMIANVSILLKTHKNSVVIPADAVLNSSFDDDASKKKKGASKMAVLVLNGSGLPETRWFTVGLKTRSGLFQVLDGLQEGERFILRGHNLYRKGFPIRIVKQ